MPHESVKKTDKNTMHGAYNVLSPMQHEKMPIETCFIEGARLLGQGRLDDAERCFRAAIAAAPDFAEAHANLAYVLSRRGNTADAEQHYRLSLRQAPDAPDVHVNLGVLLADQHRFEEAEIEYRHAITLAQGVAPLSAARAWSYLGSLQACRRQDAEAEVSLRRATALDPGSRPLRFNLSYLLLRQGRLEEGWSCLESRDWYAKLAAYFDFPRWQGEALNGKAILIGIEAGLGDMIQFTRYAAELKTRGARRVGVICHPPLKSLFVARPELDEVIGLDEPLRQPGEGERWDFWVPPLSLPYLFATRLETIPARLPYLFAPVEKSAHWAQVLRGDGQDAPSDMKVGLVWRGNPRFENDAERSLPGLNVLAPLGKVEGVRYFSLQKGAGEEEVRRQPDVLPVTDLAPDIADFSDTAAIIANLDLVISVDTAVAHLAGAMGRRCWILLPDFKTDWRWLDVRSDTPWYPGVVRLFRQSTMGDWSDVVGRLVEALTTVRGI